MSSVAPVLPPSEKPLSEAERLIDTFVAPSKTFTDLRRRANWLAPLLLIVVATEALVFVADKKVGFAKMSESALAMRPKQAAQIDQLPPDQRAASMERFANINRMASYGSPIIVVVFLVIIAAVLLGTFNFGLGAELTFNQCIAVCMYASLPILIKDALAMIALSFGGGDAFTLQNPLASNLSVLFDPSSHFLYALGTYIDLFAIWTLVLSGIGFSCLTKVKRGTCMAVIFAWWAVFILAMAGLAAL